MERKDAPVEMTWNKEDVYADWQAWQAEFDIAVSELGQLSEFNGKLKTGPDAVLAFFDEWGRQWRRMWKLGNYARMSSVVDGNDMTAQGNFGQAYGLLSKFGAATAFAQPELLEVGEALSDWIEQEPKLVDYNKYFDDLMRQKAHQRSAEVEEVMSMFDETYNSILPIYTALTNTDLKFADAVDSEGNPHPVQQSTITPTGIQSTDREHRRTAWENFCDSHLGMENTLAATYLTNIKAATFEAKVRGYDSVAELRLAPVSLPTVYLDNLVAVFKDNLHIWHKYWDVKRRILQVDTIHPYDIWAPIVDNPPVISYQQSVDWICEAMQPLGAEYVSVMRRGCLEDRWVDYAPNTGKRQGAASSIAVDGAPPFIFMSYDDTLLAMSVLAHELGHSMHGYFTHQTQPDVYNGYDAISMGVAETASNFNQALTRHYLRQEKGDDRAFQIAMIDEAIFNFHRYFFQMPNLVQFELEVSNRVWAGQPITAPILKDIMSTIYAAGYGDTMTNDVERTSITWAQFGHLYIPFYTFQYAIGISAAHAMADKVLANEPNAADNYLNFLKAGGSLYSDDLFKLGGVDMNSKEPVQKAFDVLAGMVDQLESLIE